MRALPDPNDGRTWVRSCYPYDITPQTRYEMGVTFAAVGDPIRFPHLAELPRVRGWGSHRERWCWLGRPASHTAATMLSTNDRLDVRGNSCRYCLAAR